MDPALTPDMVADILTRRFMEATPHSRSWYRSNAIRSLTGAKKHISQTAFDLEDMKRLSVCDLEEGHPTLRASKSETDPSHGGKLAVVEFTSAAVAVLENQGTVRLGIKRTGRLNIPVAVKATTINGTATSVNDYKPFDDHIQIEIIDDNIWEPDEFFFVKLKVVSNTEACVLGSISICEVTIINDDEPGVLEFCKPSFLTKETDDTMMIPVVRKNGADGRVTVKWVTKDITAVEGRDYLGKGGVLTFDDQEINKNIVVRCIPSHKAERDDSFQVELKDPTGGAILGKIHKTIVTIVTDEEFSGLVSRIVNMSKATQEALELPSTTFSQQFVEAMNVNGGDLENATFMSYVLHFLSFFWKFSFAFIPPTHICGGWVTFIVSLSVIGLLTAVIGDLASIFGCLIGLEDSITAITLVAMGTSMPDTFASKTAAIMEKTADSSIGNVNGSNSVNVFLGLGLPWMLASVYHYLQGGVFRVKAGTLGFSVMIYSIVAVIAIIILICRRTSSAVGAELGGPKCIKIVCSIVFLLLWVVYILLSALQVKGYIKTGLF
ncbi:unnamed protein product [Candidula unifasciata]|uniref:Calx-beta domain-containing protein n=1 Tax=Candidula unifasciata TaxID=100452 RepID=A0A8S4ABH3_9EUPU|nr:unnamed protein product [Candidula unifasciata]